MTTLGLVGSGISHSKSREVYQKILQREISYHLLDYDSQKSIPLLSYLFECYNLDGLSITSPFKTHFLSQVECVNDEVKSLNVINCIKKEGGIFLATNTDLMACREILVELVGEHHFSSIHILGNGSMVRMLELILSSLSISYKIYSRASVGSLENLDLSNQKKSLIINACSRSFNFQGKISSDSYFWDLNYGLENHQKKISQVCHYMDGYSLLLKQAEFALQFWAIS